MAPNMEEPLHNCQSIDTNDNIQIVLTPLSELSSSSEVELSGSESDVPAENLEEYSISEDKNCLPLEQNLKELLIRVSNTENLETVTHLKLRVISREATLQQLNIYVPALRELILDGSIISSLRDLGYGLRNLKTLKVNRCNLNCIDGVFGLEFLEELYAADNNIDDITPCAFLFNIKTIDVSRNNIKDVRSLSFLSICVNLKRLNLEENDELVYFPKYRKLVQKMLPQLQILDGVPFTQDQGVQAENIYEETTLEIICNNEGLRNNVSQNPSPSTSQQITARPRILPIESGGFTVCFPPRLFLNRSPNINTTNPTSTVHGIISNTMDNLEISEEED